MIQLGIMKMPIDKVSALQKFWIDTKSFFDIITYTSPFLAVFFASMFAFVSLAG